MKVLILDDERAMHTIMKQMLARVEGIERVECFLEPAEAVEYARKEAVDVAFIDIKIGRENGLQAAAQLRALAGGLDIVFVTSHKEYALESFETYPLDYIVKPISRSRLEQTIARAFERRAQNAADKQAEPRLQVRALGGLEISGVQGGRVRWISRKSAELFAYLLLCRGQFVAKGRIIEDIFLEMPIKNAEIYMNTAVYQLRKALTPLGMKAIVQSANEQYRLEMREVAVDFVHFEEQVNQWNRGADSRAELDEGIALEQQYTGALFEDNAYQWCAAEQYRLEQLYMSFAKRLARELAEHRRYEQAVIVLRRVLALAELDEEANLLLLHAYREQKDRLALQAHLRHYADLYEQQLGLPLPVEASSFMIL